MCKQKTTDIKLPLIFPSVQLHIHKNTDSGYHFPANRIRPSRDHPSLNWIITVQKEDNGDWPLCANWKPNGRCYRKFLPHTRTHEPTKKKEQCTLLSRQDLTLSPRIKQWGLCKSNTVAKGLVALNLERKENFLPKTMGSNAEYGNYSKCRLHRYISLNHFFFFKINGRRKFNRGGKCC